MIFKFSKHFNDEVKFDYFINKNYETETFSTISTAIYFGIQFLLLL